MVIFVNKNVVRRDIPMDKTFGLELKHSPSNLPENIKKQCESEWPFIFFLLVCFYKHVQGLAKEWKNQDNMVIGFEMSEKLNYVWVFALIENPYLILNSFYFLIKVIFYVFLSDGFESICVAIFFEGEHITIISFIYNFSLC